MINTNNYTIKNHTNYYTTKNCFFTLSTSSVKAMGMGATVESHHSVI